MRKVVIALAVAAGMVTVATPIPASAMPIGCSAHRYYPSSSTEGARARCQGGSGHYRAVALCTNKPGNGKTATYYSAWYRPSSTGRAVRICPPGAKYIVAAKFERISV